MVVADHLYRTHPDLPEGELTRTRAALVCEESLVEVAQALGLGEYLKLGKGEEAGGGRDRPSIHGRRRGGGAGRRSIWTAASARPGRSSRNSSSDREVDTA